MDSHVHLHGCFQIVEFLSAALANMGLSRSSDASRVIGVLCLTDSPGPNALARLGETVAGGQVGEWLPDSTRESESLILRRGTRRLLVIAGRQIATRERLEVLAIGTEHAFPHVRSLRDTVSESLDVGAVPIVPGGFGQWWFDRGKKVRQLFDSRVGERAFLGDSGNRTPLLGEPKLLQWARTRGVIVLAGSDPLPFRSQISRVGSYGFCLDGELSGDRPAVAIKARLNELRAQPATFGRLTRPMAFLGSQLRMQANLLGARFR